MYGGDARGYYEYLEWGISGKSIDYESNNSYKRDQGRILKYGYGTALFQLPFYCAASALQANQPDNFEYTQIDDVFISIGASLYIALALFLLYQLLGKFTSSYTSKYITVALIYFATNLYHYSAIELMMSHLYSFLSVTGYLYFTLHYIETKNKNHFFVSLLFLFLIIAIRPFNVLIVIPILAYLYLQIKSLSSVVFSIASIAFAFFIQLVLWHLQCGSWTFASYDGEGFYWFNPQLTNVLFSFRKGLFIYSPAIFIGFIGLLIAFRSHTKLIFTLICICIFFTYAVSCWWHWPYGDSFGHRAFIDLYALPAIGMVFLFNYNKRLIVKTSLFVILSICLILNLFQTWQYGKFILSPEYMSYGKYKATLFETDRNLINGLGGAKDIFPYKAKYTRVIDSIPSINMSSNEYSQALSFNNHPRLYKKCYVDVSFLKEELLPNQTFDARLLFQRTDTVNKEVGYFGACLNEGKKDYLIPNSKSFSYQFEISALKSTEVLLAFFTNPEHKNFAIKNFKVSVYYIQ
ncbi:MAG: hypothetical protein V4565_02855 [Bacteroidota bacterium]